MPATDPIASVVIPCFNEVGTLRDLHAQIRAEFNKLQMPAEIIFIDDGSNDGSCELLRTLAAEDPGCRVIYYRRNCGKAAALQTGFNVARGQYIITMDADLQDDPREIPRFIEALQHADLIGGWKATRHDPLGKTLPSKLANATARKVTGVQLHDMNCGFKGYRRQVIKEVALYGELHRYIPALAAARGFRIMELAVTHHPRRSGQSKYGLERLIRGFLDLLTVVYITKYRFRPLHFFGGAGLLCLLFAVAIEALTMAMSSVLGAHAPALGYAMAVGNVALLVLAPVLFGFGLIAEGQLVSTFKQTPQPPIAETLNLEQRDEVTHAG